MSTTTKLVAVLVLVLLIGGLSYWVLEGSWQSVAPQSSAPPASTAAAPSAPATAAPAARRPRRPRHHPLQRRRPRQHRRPTVAAPSAPPHRRQRHHQLHRQAAAPSAPTVATSAAPPASTAAAPSLHAHGGRGYISAPGAIDGRGTTRSRDSSPGSAAGLDGRGTIGSRDSSPGELARRGRDVGSKPTANPRSTASLRLLQGVCGRYFRAADPRGNPPLSARDRGRHHWSPHCRRGQSLGQPVTGRPAGASITCRPPRPRRVPMPAAIASALCGLLCTGQPGAHPAARPVTAGACRPRCAHPSCRHVRRHRGRGRRDPCRLRAARRVVGRGRAAPAVPRRHRHRAGPRVCPDHRRLEAAARAARRDPAGIGSASLLRILLSLKRQHPALMAGCGTSFLGPKLVASVSDRLLPMGSFAVQHL